MKVILFGGTGMLGQGVLRECLLDDRVEEVLAVGRSPVGKKHHRLRQIVRKDLYDLGDIESDLAGFDACFFCLGVSAFRMSEADYRHVTYDLTLAVATALARITPQSTFIYVSGAGTDIESRQMWARVKGTTERDVLALPLQGYMFRPGIIQPTNGIESKTRLYRAAYAAATPLFPVLKRVGNLVVTNEQVGKAMIEVADHGAPSQFLGNKEIGLLA